MADDNTIIEGAVKFREGKKWKSRWCVLRKLSPVADCVQLEVWRDARARAAGGAAGAGGGAGGGVRAALALAGWVGAEAGFALDQHSHTLALLCRDAAAALAFDSPERLLHWQVKVATHVGPSRYYLVQVASGGAAGAPRGPARLHVAPRRAALSTGVPPRLLVVWEIAHLRRYGVVDGRFCLEGGALSGRGEGLFVLVTDRAHDIARDFDRAARGKLSPRDRRYTLDAAARPPSELRLADAARTPLSRRARALDTPDDYDEPYWPSSERVQSPDAASLGGEGAGGAGGAGGGAALARCVSCMSKLGTMSRSSTAGGSPPRGHFRPAWTMEGLAAAARGALPEDCACPPERPPKPRWLNLPPARAASPAQTTPGAVGPYENYDVPKMPFEEVSRMVDEYYDTPKRLKECLNDELFRMTRSSTTDSLVLKKSCGCLLKVGRRRPGWGSGVGGAAGAGGTGEEGAACACRRVTAWAHSWMRLPLCRREDKENEPAALYATIDPARKRRPRPPAAPAVDDGPLANYENLSFALSLEHYENAKDVLKRAGVTQTELDALRAHVDPGVQCACGRCGAGGEVGDYLLMRPPVRPSLPAGYTPMSPLAPAPHSLQRPPRPALPPPPARSASHPALCEVGAAGAAACGGDAARRRRRGRSSSADSSRFLDDDDDDDEPGSECGGGSSTETLRRAPRKLSDAESSEACTKTGGEAAGSGGGNRDSSSSNDSGVSSSTRSRAARRRPPRPRARSSDPLAPPALRHAAHDKCSSAEAAVPVLSQPRKGPADSRSTSSGASDMSDYIETLSLCSSHSSTDTPDTLRVARLTTSTLRPRSGKEYQQLAAPARAPPAPHPSHPTPHPPQPAPPP